ncbi:hypothetical protein JHW45_16345 [Paracoccus stylophorae]|uniref:WYL domain-containing protein n=1 Tax=Paracoccus stylophorae TaxID=659350 RepID=A0ABY7SUQ7_9RHOB|nr:DUF6478 family protein [Paracoccus stylophorae]WCR10593.1 hypothetical protein JHW45_16345 [Paracoccus stylophorae]
MAGKAQDWLSRRLRDRAVRHWDAQADALARRNRVPPPDLRDQAAALHRSLTRFLQLSDSRLPRGGGASLAVLPPGTDWQWRPLMLRGRISPDTLSAPADGQPLGDEVTLFHDCPHRALILRQRRNRRATDLAPYCLTLEMLGFSGSYLSLALAVPPDARQGFDRHRIVRLDALLQSERAIRIYARLNIAQGPNTETVLRQLGDPVEGRDCARTVEFDLGFADLSDRAVDKVWLDLLFEAPYMNAVTLSDAVLSRHSRAEI